MDSTATDVHKLRIVACSIIWNPAVAMPLAEHLVELGWLIEKPDCLSGWQVTAEGGGIWGSITHRSVIKATTMEPLEPMVVS